MFKKEYKLVRQEGESCIYENSKSEIFKIPISLVEELVNVATGAQGKHKTAVSVESNEARYEAACKERPTLKRVYEFINNSDGRLLQSEIAEGLSLDAKNIKSRYLLELIELNMIEEERDGRHLRYSSSSQRSKI
jgi:hypothetical protein